MKTLITFVAFVLLSFIHFFVAANSGKTYSKKADSTFLREKAAIEELALRPTVSIPTVHVSHDKNYFRTQSNAVWLVRVTSSSSDGLQVDLNPDPNFSITAINAPAKWTCNIGTKTCTRADDGSTFMVEFIQVIGTVNANAPATITNGATLTGGGLGTALSETDVVLVYNPSKIVQWGKNQFGQTTNKPTGSGYTQLAFGFRESAALTTDGSIVEWGVPTYDIAKPSGSGYLAIAAGTSHRMALTGDGHIVGWGRNLVGQLNGIPTGSGFIAIAATDASTIALTNEGRIVQWGSYDNTDFPTTSGYVAIAGGYNHGHALTYTGTNYMWGANGTDQRNGVPTDGGWKAIAANNYNGLAQRQDGTLYMWGTSSNNPTEGLPSAAVAAFGAGALNSGCWAMSSDGSISIWGDAFGVFQANKPGTGGYAVGSVTLGLNGAGVLLPLANPTVNGGNGQSAKVNTAFATPLSVKVLDGIGNPVQDLSITFSAPASGASGTFSNNTTSITVLTNSNGIASTTFTANGTGGQYTVTASYSGLDAVSFTLSNTSHRIYVNKANLSGTYNGLSWATAYNDLQSTLAVATANDTLWVAKGTYYPTTSTTDRTASFTMKNNVAIYGGFQGNETMLNQRNWRTNETIMSGDIDHATDPLAVTGGGSTLSITGNSGNSNTVIKNNNLNNTAILDGFTVLGGNSPGLAGGMFNVSSSPTITNVIFKYNSASMYGGGMYNGSSSPIITNTKFLYNYAANGGGIAGFGSPPTITNSMFSNNKAVGDGGGIYNGSSAIITNSTFFNNAAINGRAVFQSGSNSDLYNCILWNNGGNSAIGKASSGTLTVTNCLIEPLETDYTVASSTPAAIKEDPLFVDAANGDFSLKPCSPAIDMGATGGNTPNTDILGNPRFDMPDVGTSTVDIGAYERQTAGSTSPTVTAPANLTVYYPATLQLTASCPAGTVQWSDGSSGTGITLSSIGTYAISATCMLDGCSSSASISTNLEIKKPHRIYVNHANTSGNYDGFTWATAFVDLQTALAATTTNDSIWVAKGTYYPDEGTGQSDNNRSAAFTMKNNVAIYGGFSGTETLLSQRNLSTNATILSGDIDKNDVSNDISGNSYHIIYNGNTTDNTAILDGFVLTGGNANVTGNNNYVGGAVYNDGRNGICHPVFRNCIFRFNKAGSGGAVSNYGSNGSCNPTFTNCLFYGNQAVHNSHLSFGGAMYCLGNVISTLTNCTFINNYALGYGGGLMSDTNFGSPNFTFTNCIFWGNTAASGNQIYSFVSTMNISNTIFEGGVAALIHINSGTINDNGGNSTSDPLFADATNGDFRLKPCSPAIDMGATGSNIPTTDIEGNARFDMPGVGTSTIDIGAYETQTGLPVSPTITAPTSLSVYYPATLQLTATCPAGTVKWSDGSSGTGITLSSIGTYAISATCMLDGCSSSASASTNLEIKKPHRIYVNHANTSGTYNGFTWATAYSDLQTALASATTNDSIWVAKGTYYPDEGAGQTNNNRNATFAMKNNVAIYGGFLGTETLLSQRNLSTNATILSGDLDQNDSGDLTDASNSGNSGHVIYNGNTINNTAILDGFTIISGSTYGSTPGGGGIFNDGRNGICNPVIRNCIFRLNLANKGAAVANYGDGGSCNPTFTNCLFYGNQVLLSGGASYGGAMYCQGNVESVLTNCTFSKNYAFTFGGAIYCTTANSETPKLTLKNCILWGNTDARTGVNQILNNGSTINISNTILEGGFEGITGNNGTNNDNEGNSFTNPLFMDAANMDFSLQACSPAIDKGSTGGDVPASDILGNARFDMPGVGTSIVDIGAYERQTPSSLAGPTVSTPTQSIVCAPNSIILTATCTTGTVLWSNSATGTSTILSTVGTYSITATCLSNGCSSDESSARVLEIKAKPTTPTVSTPAQSIVCAPNKITLTATCTTGTVLWSNSATGTSIDISTVGTYSITATCVSNGCSSDASSARVLEIKAKPTAPTVSTPAQSIVCSPNNITLTATCTTGTVLWSNSATGTIIDISTVGTYSITATCVSNGCSSDASTVRVLEIKAKPTSPTISTPAQAVVCAPNSIILTATCTTGTVLWSNSATGTSIDISTVGTYSITATCVSNGCSSDASTARVLEIKAKPTSPTINTPAQAVVCAPNSIRLTATCTTGTVLWSNSATGTSIDISTVGTYSITATCVSNGCISDASTARVLEIKAKPAAPTVSTPSQAVVCSPNSIILTATCTTGTVLWSNSATGTSTILSTVGTYSITATCVSNGCSSDASTARVLEIKAKPTAPTVSTPAQSIVCSPNNITLTATCTTGTVLWSNSATGTSIDISTVGTYSITATCVSNGCSSDASSARVLEIKAKPTAPTVSTPTNAIVCAPNSIILTATCTTGTVLWSNSATGTSTILSTVGTYSITATCLSNGCSSDASSARVLEIKAKPTAPTVSTPTNAIVCAPNSITLTATCTTGTVLWSNSATGTSIDISTVGTYSITANCVSNSCSSDASSARVLEIKAKPTTPIVSTPAQSIVCAPNSIVLTATCVSGTVLWSNSATGTSIDISTVGTYSITATCVSNGCSSDASSARVLEIKAKPTAPTVSTPTNAIACAPNSIILTATCTTGTVLWSNSATGTSIDISTVGTYSITATCVSNGCSSDASMARVLEIKAKPTAPTVSTPTNAIVCAPNSIILTATCTTGKVLWSNSATGASIEISTVGTYSITATCVSNGCSSDASTARILEIKAKPTAPTVSTPTNAIVCAPNSIILTATCTTGTVLWSNSATGTSIEISTVGTYSITATCVSNGCSSDASTARVLEIKAKPTAPTVSTPTNAIVCAPNSIILTATCTTGTVLWSNSATGTSIDISTVGTYSITATCVSNGCSSDASSARVLEIKAKPTAPTVSTPTNAIVCAPNSIILTATCTTGTVLWSNSATGTSIDISTVGTYSITATCVSNGCSSDASSARVLEIKAKPTSPTINTPAQAVVCAPNSIRLTATCVTGTILWSNSATGTSIDISTVGTYSITATCVSNGCSSDASTARVLEIKAKPAAPTVSTPAQSIVCAPNSIRLTATCMTGTVLWSNSATGTSIDISTVGTYSITANCVSNSCSSDASMARVLEIKAKPTAPTVSTPAQAIVCSPNSITLTASCATGTVLWSNSATGTSMDISTVGTYSITATCVSNGCSSDASSARVLEIKTKPSAPTVSTPAQSIVCAPNSITLTASCATGTVLWSNSATGTSIDISTVGTYSITAKCVFNGCESDASAARSIEIKALPIVSATNSGPYTVGQTINLAGTGNGTYNWSGPNSFTSSSSNPSIPNALSVNGGIYTLAVIGVNGCNAMATTNVMVNGVDPCDPSRIVDYMYVKAGNPYQPLFSLSNGMIINQINEQVSILVTPSLCPSVNIESFEMNIQGPELNWNIIQNVSPNSLFDNLGSDIWGRNFNPGTYTLTVTGYAQDNKGGGLTYGPKIIKFTVIGNLATINAPTLSKNDICAGSSIDVTFSTSGGFNTGNQFNIELSDSSGNFANPTLIGTTNTTGTQTCMIPQNMPEGEKYLIRVASSNQVVVSNPAINKVKVYPYTYDLNNPADKITGVSTKKATAMINAANKITSPATVTYQAGKSILLMPGFETGAIFKAEIKGCDN